MILKEAVDFRNKYIKKVIGQAILNSKKDSIDLTVKDVIVTTYKDMDAILSAMHIHAISNDAAVLMVCNPNDDFEVFIISKFNEGGVVTHLLLTNHLDRTNGW